MERFIFLTLGLLVVAFSLRGAKGCCCPRDWLPNNGFCYKVFNEPRSWKDAELFCRKYKPGCHLASMHSREESADLGEYVSDYLKSGENVWIGLNDPQKQRNWQWTDRSRNSYLAWEQGEPNNEGNNEYCAELWSLSGAQRTCLKGWYSRNSYCHKVFGEQKSWNDAKMFCEKREILPPCHHPKKTRER